MRADVPQMTFIAVPNIPFVQPGDDLAALILQAMAQAHLTFADGDVLVVAQKVVSKAEGRCMRLADVQPTAEALRLAEQVKRDPRHIQVVLDESKEIIRLRPGLIISEQWQGFICANAGVDHSNVAPGNEWVLLLPKDPDGSARALRERVRQETGHDVAVLIVDSHGRPWRNGVVGVTIGVAGMQPVEDWRGKSDLFGRTLEVTTIAVADMVASAASLLMGQADEGRPVVIARGVPRLPGDGTHWDLLRPREMDLFR